MPHLVGTGGSGERLRRCRRRRRSDSRHGGRCGLRGHRHRARRRKAHACDGWAGHAPVLTPAAGGRQRGRFIAGRQGRAPSPPPPHPPTSRGSHDRSDRGSAARMGDTDRPRPERGGGSPRPSAGADDGASARRWGEGVRPAGTAAVSAATAALRLPSPPPPSSSEGAALAAEDEHPVATDTADPTDSNDEGVANHAPEPPAARPPTPPRVSSARPPLASPQSRLPPTTPAPLHQSPLTSTRSPRSLGGGGGRATAAAAAGVTSSPQPSPAIAMTRAAAADRTSKPARTQRVRSLRSPRAGGGEKSRTGLRLAGSRAQWAARMRNTGRPSARPPRVWRAGAHDCSPVASPPTYPAVRLPPPRGRSSPGCGRPLARPTKPRHARQRADKRHSAATTPPSTSLTPPLPPPPPPPHAPLMRPTASYVVCTPW